MNQKLLTMIVLIFIGLNINNVSIADSQCDKIAVVDVQKVVAASSQIKNLHKAQAKKNNELGDLLKKAQADVNKQTDENKKISIAKNYEKQLIAKREASIKEYTSKLQEADSNITNIIGKKATELGYTIVIPKSAVIYGGTDITDEILKVIK